MRLKKTRAREVKDKKGCGRRKEEEEEEEEEEQEEEEVRVMGEVEWMRKRVTVKERKAEGRIRAPEKAECVRGQHSHAGGKKWRVRV